MSPSGVPLLLSAMSLRIFPPVRNVSRPTVLVPLQRMGLTIRQRPPKKLPIP